MCSSRSSGAPGSEASTTHPDGRAQAIARFDRPPIGCAPRHSQNASPSSDVALCHTNHQNVTSTSLRLQRLLQFEPLPAQAQVEVMLMGLRQCLLERCAALDSHATCPPWGHAASQETTNECTGEKKGTVLHGQKVLYLQARRRPMTPRLARQAPRCALLATAQARPQR